MMHNLKAIHIYKICNMKHSHTFVSCQSSLDYDVRPDTRQAGFCGPGIHQQLLIKGRDPEISQAARPSKLKRQIHAHIAREGDMARNARASKTCPQLSSRLSSRKDNPGDHQTTTDQAVQTTTPRPEKSLHRRKGEPKCNIIIHRHPRRANTKGRQTGGVAIETPKKLEPRNIAVGKTHSRREPS